MEIVAGDIFIKNYIDFQRHFLALKDPEQTNTCVECFCVDLQTGEKEYISIPIHNMNLYIKIL